jgi:hypothetical protein
MKFAGAMLGCLLIVSFVACSKQHPQSGRRAAKRAYEQAARVSAIEWLELLDDGDYEEAYDREPARLRAGGTVRQFIRSMRARRAPFGKTISRKFIGAAYSQKLTGAPDGNYESVLFKTSFEHKTVAAERVILSRDHGTWRVVDYRLY